jgi:hypothetical protein
MRIGISGHRRLTPATEALITRLMHEELAGYPASGLAGISCLADGADQIFAQAVIDAGGRLEVIVPAARYRATLPESALVGFDTLLGQASAVDWLPFDEPDGQAYMEAARVMLDRVDALIAVWDGLPARGLGGTADVVTEAGRRRVPVIVIWPPDAWRAD